MGAGVWVASDILRQLRVSQAEVVPSASYPRDSQHRAAGAPWLCQGHGDSAISRCFLRVGSGPPHSTQSNTRKQLLIDRIDHHGSISAKRLNVNRRDGRTTPLEVEDENPVQNLDSAPAALAM